MAAWAAARPAGTSPADALAWLQQQGIEDRLIEAILPILQGLWAEAWDSGTEAATEVAAIQQDINQQQRQTRLAQLALVWAGQITATTLALIAGLLAGGGASAAAVTALLADASRAKSIAQTEVSRLMSEAAASVYARANVQHVRWITEPPDPCPACLSNEAAGAWPLGVPFPSGAVYPPDHPNCRCALVPA